MATSEASLARTQPNRHSQHLAMVKTRYDQDPDFWFGGLEMHKGLFVVAASSASVGGRRCDSLKSKAWC